MANWIKRTNKRYENKEKDIEKGKERDREKKMNEYNVGL